MAHYSFARCRLDTVSREIRLDGSRRHLSPKAFELLVCLIEARPRVVPKPELMQRLWPDSFVEEANLPVLIREVRAAIGDAGAAQIIRTHHRIGYGFAAAVDEDPLVGGQPPNRTGAVLLLQGRRAVLSAGVNIVGRESDADVCVDDPSVSRRHARIIVAGTNVTIEDLGSKNGTRVRGAPVSTPTTLVAGDSVSFSGVEALFKVEDVDETASNPQPLP